MYAASTAGAQKGWAARVERCGEEGARGCRAVRDGGRDEGGGRETRAG